MSPVGSVHRPALSADAGQLAAAAEALVGVPFRLHGRDPATGLDCLGVLGAALAASGRPVALPIGYRLRLATHEGWVPRAAALGFAEALPPIRTGDAVLLGLGGGQYHLAIAASQSGWVHAHAGLRRVVHSPARPAGAVLHHWRLAPPRET